jgi:SAM-dependent methyltransferase
MTGKFSTGYYFAMRVLRRSLFPVAVPRRLRRAIPWMRRNFGTTSISGVVSLYDKHLSRIDQDWIRSREILEIGIGETNSSCYEMAARGAAKCYALEPFVALDPESDRTLLQRCADSHKLSASTIADRVVRLSDAARLGSESVDLVLSNAVLEHVTEMDRLVADLRRVLRPGGRMLHIVDYRDHFFTYPYHHLLWSDAVWQKYLNPGDLPRWRIGDHIEAFTRGGFDVTVLKAVPISAAFEKVRHRVHPRFQRYSERDLTTAFGVLHIQKT